MARSIKPIAVSPVSTSVAVAGVATADAEDGIVCVMALMISMNGARMRGLKMNIASLFNPAHPDPLSSFRIPRDPQYSAVKPSGW